MNSTAPAHLPQNCTAVEIAKYHIHPDVLMRYPAIEEWAASHDDDSAGELANLLESLAEGELANLLESLAEGEVLERLEAFLDNLPDPYDKKHALEAVRADIEAVKRLTEFRDKCIEALDDDVAEAEARILESIRLGEGMRRLMEELGVKS